MSHSEKNIVTWDGPADPENPFNWPLSRKWRVTILACSITFLSGLSGTALAPTAPLLTSTFHLAPDSSRDVPPTYYPIFAWTLSAGVVPLLLLPLMETRYGVRTPYILCVLVLALSTIPQALAPSGAYPLLVAIRVLSGGAAGVLQNVTGGIVGDLAVYAALVPASFILLPETRGGVILSRRAAAIRHSTGRQDVHAEDEEGHLSLSELLKDAVGRPLRMLTTEPLVACSTLWSAFCFGNALLFTQSIPRVYGELYGWESWRAGVVQAGLLVGVTLGKTKWQSSDSETGNRGESEKERGETEAEEETFLPEARLYLAVPASFLGLSGGLFLYAWTALPSIHWLAPTAGLVLVGAGIFTVVTAASNYVEDAYSRYAASALAGVAFGENLTGAFLPLAEQALYTHLGLRWASCLLAFVAVALSFAPVLLLWKGEVIRKRSPFIREARYENSPGVSSSDHTL
ncbi:putative mfs multidrug [Diplodia seriata]|uniref:Putative mfs multidrug n=1 Tax=Diplodia seriata TaxID=420778 RepID=A0A0G2GUJ6_9PEZI|nr:putative mfs multidrug [Diplodia seriata]